MNLCCFFPDLTQGLLDDEIYSNSSSESDGDIDVDGDAHLIGTSWSTFHIDDWLTFRIDTEAATLIMHLRQKWHSLFLRRMRSPTKQWTPYDESIIRAVIQVLTSEERALDLQQPAGIGQRPRPMSSETVVSSGGSHSSSTDVDHFDDAASIVDQLSTSPTRTMQLRGKGLFHIFVTVTLSGIKNLECLPSLKDDIVIVSVGLL